MENKKSKVVIILIFIALLGSSFAPLTSSATRPPMTASDRTFDGQILFAPYYTTTTYLIDSSGTINHTWPSNYQPFTSAYWLGNGTIIRPICSGGGGLQIIRWDGSLAWDWRNTQSGWTCHHDIKVLPNGNVLMIVWVTMTRNQAIQAGRNPNTISGNSFTPDKLIEVKQTGQTTGQIVWEWNIWDHLIQDYDSSKDNYGNVSVHPELIDINFGENFVGDWLHTNALDYDPVFDQVLVDVHNFGEFWVIDHSTTTEEAAGHTGGHYGHGGDLLYRWGNPQSYGRGDSSDKQLFGQHGATWVKRGYPGAGNILVFNNGWNRPGNDYTSIEEVTPPIDSGGNYYLAEGAAYGPENVTWTYATSFYSSVFGGQLRLMNGDTLICGGTTGKFLEVAPNGTIMWQWTNHYPSQSKPDVFKIDYIPMTEPVLQPNLDGEGSLSWSDVKPGSTVTGSFRVRNVGDAGSSLNWTVNRSGLTWGTWTFSPESGHGLTPEYGPVTVQVSVVAPDDMKTEFQGQVVLQNLDNTSDSDTIPVVLTTPSGLSLPVTNPFLQLVQRWFLLLQRLFEGLSTQLPYGLK